MKVYAVVPATDVLIVAGDHVPVMGVASDDELGREGGIPPMQVLGIAGIVGTIPGVIVTFIVAGPAH